MQFKASAPGSLMLLGEYAVLHGKHALVCAVDKRITVLLTPRNDERITIQSALHGEYTTDLYHLAITSPYHFVLGALKQYQPKMRRGCDLEITAEFSDKMGLGSSAAVTVATIATLITWLNIRMSPIDLVRQGRQVVRQVQGIGSGADVAASVYGGIVGYQAQPLTAEKISTLAPLTALYAGFKTPTVTAIKQVQEHFSGHQSVFRHITNSIGQCALDGMQYARKEDWHKLGELMNMQQGLMESLGVSMPVLRAMVDDLREQSIYGAKISGSGLGDCVIGLGAVPEQYTFSRDFANVRRIPVMMTLQGVVCEKV